MSVSPHSANTIEWLKMDLLMSLSGNRWEWLRWILSVDNIKRLLADEYKGNEVVSNAFDDVQL